MIVTYPLVMAGPAPTGGRFAPPDDRLRRRPPHQILVDEAVSSTFSQPSAPSAIFLATASLVMCTMKVVIFDLPRVELTLLDLVKEQSIRHDGAAAMMNDHLALEVDRLDLQRVGQLDPALPRDVLDPPSDHLRTIIENQR
jgi:hypothetical protein